MMPQSTASTVGRRQLVAYWYELYSVTLGQYLLRVLGDQEQAADALHDTFMRAYTSLSALNPPANPAAWLQRIATNVAYTALRKRKRFRWLTLGETHSGADLERRTVLSDTIRSCLGQLGKKEAEALLLFEYGGLSCLEIAALYGEQPSATRVRIFRARQRFRQLYAKEQ